VELGNFERNGNETAERNQYEAEELLFFGFKKKFKKNGERNRGVWENGAG
jgi:hypothetical protein